jgi:hypothetical protein
LKLGEMRGVVKALERVETNDRGEVVEVDG